MSMTPTAKAALSRTIRALRERLLTDLRAANESAYRLSVRAQDAGLGEAARCRRGRLESWAAEQSRSGSGKKARAVTEFFRQAEKQAAYTLLNRLVILRLMEGMGLRPRVVTGGKASRLYNDFRDVGQALVGDPSEGFSFLLQLVFEELATDLPGLYGPAGVADLVPVPAATLLHVVETLDDAELASCWTDDMTLGWVYQYWNDPEREAIDKKLNDGGKVQPHEIASKTQMFTERYMVDWLLQNSLVPLWFAICARHGWTPEVVGSPEAPGLLDELERRRAQWRQQRDDRANALADEGLRASFATEDDMPGVSLTALMPLTEEEHLWAYYVPQPLPADAVATAPESVRDLKILDPAVGSGHFLVVAFDVLWGLYREEARHRGEAGQAQWSDAAIAESILEKNLHGIDLDPRAVQIAAAALWLKARRAAAQARPRQLQLVAANLGLASLPDDDPALVELRRAVEAETGIPAALTDTVVQALRGADHLGSLLQVDAAVARAIAVYEGSAPGQIASWPASFDGLGHAPPPTAREVDGAGSMGRADPEVPAHLAPSATIRRANPEVTAHLAPSATIRRADPELTAHLAPSATIRRANPEVTAHLATSATIAEQLETFLAAHTGGDDLGLQLRGRQLAAGVRFLRLLRPGAYDLVVGNPPYQGTSKMADASYVAKHYKRGKADLYAAFLERGLQLARKGGVSALLTMRNWMFIKQYADLRMWLLERFHLWGLGDFDRGAFEDVPDEVVSVVGSVFRKVSPEGQESMALLPTPRDDTSRDSARTQRKRAAVRCHVGRHTFTPSALQVVPEWPLIYWWSDSFLAAYGAAPKLLDVAPTRYGMGTRNDPRFIRRPWEVRPSSITLPDHPDPAIPEAAPWVPYVKGGRGTQWFEPVSYVVPWGLDGFLIRVWIEFYREAKPGGFISNPQHYFQLGVSCAPVGHEFSARVHRCRSIFGDAAPTIFEMPLADAVCMLNTSMARRILQDLNPTVRFQPNDVNRLPVMPPTAADRILATLRKSSDREESRREPSLEYVSPGPSDWHAAQDWAQSAVDRDSDVPSTYVARFEPEDPRDHLSHALGVALGRFAYGALPDQEAGGTDPGDASVGVVFLDGTTSQEINGDIYENHPIRALDLAWAKHGSAIDPSQDLRTWLRLKFFPDVHRQMYENRPIHWPLSSGNKTFVAWVNIHRFTHRTLFTLLADHLHPTLARLDGELNDLRAARDGADKKAAAAADKRLQKVKKWREELARFIADVTQCAEKGPPPTHPDPKKCPPREVDARYDPDLDDGVMINSAALWPLLEPQWKDPKKWWTELALSKGRKDYDWSHLAMKYWPTRVDKKCQEDPSLGVAHGCFWAWHPARAWAWELRLQDEIGPDFRITEPPYRDTPADPAHRAAYLRDHALEALEAVEKEAVRRMGRGDKKQEIPSLTLLEPGLWTTHPAACWDLEDRLTTKQNAPFHLLGPDEPAARATYLTTHPDKAAHRAQHLAEVAPSQTSLLSARPDP